MELVELLLFPPVLLNNDDQVLGLLILKEVDGLTVDDGGERRRGGS